MGKYSCVGDDVSISVIKRYSESVCMFGKKKKKILALTQSKAPVSAMWFPAHGSVQIEEKKIIWTLTSAADNGLSFLQTL